MSDDTSVLPAVMAPKAPGRALLLPVLGALALGGLAAAAFYFQRASDADAVLASARTEVAELKLAAGRSRQQIDALNAQIGTLQTEMLKFREAPLPAVLSFRAGAPGKGFVAQVENQSAEALLITVAVQRAATGERKSFDLNVQARGLAELGAGDGWAFTNGDTLLVSGGQYKPLSLRIP